MLTKRNRFQRRTRCSKVSIGKQRTAGSSNKLHAFKIAFQVYPQRTCFCRMPGAWLLVFTLWRSIFGQLVHWRRSLEARWELAGSSLEVHREPVTSRRLLAQSDNFRLALINKNDLWALPGKKFFRSTRLSAEEGGLAGFARNSRKPHSPCS